MAENKTVVAKRWGWKEDLTTKRQHESILGVIELFCILIVVVHSSMHLSQLMTEEKGKQIEL